jgi:hypothetical protein
MGAEYRRGTWTNLQSLFVFLFAFLLTLVMLSRVKSTFCMVTSCFCQPASRQNVQNYLSGVNTRITLLTTDVCAFASTASRTCMPLSGLSELSSNIQRDVSLTVLTCGAHVYTSQYAVSTRSRARVCVCVCVCACVCVRLVFTFGF